MKKLDYEGVFSKVLWLILAASICWHLYQFLLLLLSPATLSLCKANSKAGLLFLQSGLIMLETACLAALTFPAGKYWKYVCLGVGGAGISYFYLIWQDYGMCELHSWSHEGDFLGIFLPIQLVWILWGMFIPYLEKRLRRCWLYGYGTTCVMLYFMHLLSQMD